MLLGSCAGELLQLIYLIGSLRNPEIPRIANYLREHLNEEVFDDWYSAGPEADDKWRDYERGRGRTYREALLGLAARNVFRFDKDNLNRASCVVLVLPAGKSAHLELGWSLGRGVPGYILVDSPDRWDVMYQFATGIFDSIEELTNELSHSTNHSANCVLPNVCYSGYDPDYQEEVLSRSERLERGAHFNRGVVSVDGDVSRGSTVAAFYESGHIIPVSVDNVRGNTILPEGIR